MKLRNYSLKTALFGALVFLFFSCGQNSDKDSTGELKETFGSLTAYQAQPASFRIFSQIPGNGDISIAVKADNRRDFITQLAALSGHLDATIDDLQANEICFLEISGMNDQTGYWRQVLPLFVVDGAEFELVADAPPAGSTEPHQLRIKGGGEEQQFLEEWSWSLYNQAIPLSDDASSFEEYDNLNQEYIEKAKPLISTFYLISRERNHRDHLDEYSKLFLQAPEAVKNSKYAVDLANHIHRITHAPTTIDFSRILTARTSRVLPFEPGAFADKEYLVLYIWASWEPQAVAHLADLEKVVSSHDNVALLYFSLDTRMSDWKPLTDKMELENSYMVRAETRQASIDELYLTQLPRIMIVRPDGQIVEHDLTFEQLEKTLAAL